MRLASGKFKHLETIKPIIEVGVIPDYRVIQHPDDVQSINQSMILRSAFKNEAKGAKLLSGKSLSIGGIDSRQKLLEAWNKMATLNVFHNLQYLKFMKNFEKQMSYLIRPAALTLGLYVLQFHLLQGLILFSLKLFSLYSDALIWKKGIGST